VKGRFVEGDGNGLTVLNAGNQQVKLGREEIFSISRRSRTRGALLGLGIGVSAGIAVGSGRYLSTGTDLNRSESAAMGATLFGLIGTIAGGVIGIKATIYQSPGAAEKRRQKKQATTPETIGEGYRLDNN
jgi:hypothetical protein